MNQLKKEVYCNHHTKDEITKHELSFKLQMTILGEKLTDIMESDIKAKEFSTILHNTLKFIDKYVNEYAIETNFLNLHVVKHFYNDIKQMHDICVYNSKILPRCLIYRWNINNWCIDISNKILICLDEMIRRIEMIYNNFNLI
jgi:hypothetical protein